MPNAVFAIERLYELLKEQIEADFKGLVLVDWGLNRLPVKLNYGTVGRVLIVPGGPGGELGTVGDVRTQHPHPARALYNFYESLSIYVYAHDPQAEKQEDRKHDHIFLLALHEVLRAIHLVTHKWPAKTSPVKIGPPKLLKPLTQGLLGREVILPCEIEQPILDMFDGELLTHLVFPTAVIADSVGNETEISTTAEAP